MFTVCIVTMINWSACMMFCIKKNRIWLFILRNVYSQASPRYCILFVFWTSENFLRDILRDIYSTKLHGSNVSELCVARNLGLNRIAPKLWIIICLFNYFSFFLLLFAPFSVDILVFFPVAVVYYWFSGKALFSADKNIQINDKY